uniref:PUM-HD domain-containing protein n=1 Tax=Attheya septentrionalis TaxID=420275 RepID=A0A7S2U7A4_9STRA|mmetsp:Transcript_10925/g.19941  ORF Transcript_10925/g.19941 Transcript_10925/m.19941 type:complete len:989 (+) Transcript_10925:314-3280(+)
MTLSVSDGNSDNMVANLGSALAGMHTDDGEIGDNRLFQNNGHSNKSQSAPLGFNRGQMSAATPNTETPSLSWGLPTTDNTLGDNSSIRRDSTGAGTLLGKSPSNGTLSDSGQSSANSSFHQLSGMLPSTIDSDRQNSHMISSNQFDRLNAGTSERKQSIDLFLSKSPSQALGEELLSLTGFGSNAPMENAENRQHPDNEDYHVHDQNPFRAGPLDVALSSELNAAGGPEIRSYHAQKSDSPVCSVTGTTTSSRSVSPTTSGNDGDNRRSSNSSFVTEQDHRHNRINNKHNSIDAYSPGVYNSNPVPGSWGNGDNKDQAWQWQAPSPAMMAPSTQNLPYEHNGSSNFHVNSSGNGNGESSRRQKPNMQVAVDQYTNQLLQTPPSTPRRNENQPQVFYVAVASPDGKSQMLQPVQMVQVPGQPGAFVVPPTAMSPRVAPASFIPDQQVRGKVAHSTGFMQPSPHSNGDGSFRDGRAVDTGNVQYQHSFQPSPKFNNNHPASHYGKNQHRHEAYQGAESSNSSQIPYSGEYPSMYGHESIDSPNRRHASTTSLASLQGGALAEEPLSSLYSSVQRPSFDQLLGHVRRLSRDQVGCRLLQQALDEDGPEAASRILNEGISFWGETMVDPFGNYLFQKMLEKITAEERIILVKSVSPRLVNASLNLHGTRSVQKILELCAADEAVTSVNRRGSGSSGTSADILIRALAPAAARLCIDSHGNHVIQRILIKLPYQYSQFVFEAVATSVGDVARHRHGCCVIQRCLDSPPSTARSYLVRRIVEKSLELMQDAYGNYVVQYVLDVCADEDVHAVCESVVGKVCLLAIQKFSSNVMEKCLERCTDRVRGLYIDELSDGERVRELIMDPFGNYVVQRALAVATHAQAVCLVECMRPHLVCTQDANSQGQHGGGMRNTAGGRRIMAKICKRFPNFELAEGNYSKDLYVQYNRGNNNRNQHTPNSPRKNQNRNRNQNRGTHNSPRFEGGAHGRVQGRGGE